MSLIRLILEYCCVVWHYAIPSYLSEQLKRVQIRAFGVIFPKRTTLFGVEDLLNEVGKLLSACLLEGPSNVPNKVVSMWVLEGLLKVLDKVLSALALPVANVANK